MKPKQRNQRDSIILEAKLKFNPRHCRTEEMANILIRKKMALYFAEELSELISCTVKECKDGENLYMAKIEVKDIGSN